MKVLASVLITLALAFWPQMLSCAPSSHTITATWSYDFSVDNACSATITTGCVKQFNVYDLTATKTLLYSITAPSGANTAMTGLTNTSAPLTLKAGQHIFGLSVVMADGTENDPAGCSNTAGVKPANATGFAVIVN